MMPSITRGRLCYRGIIKSTRNHETQVTYLLIVEKKDAGAGWIHTFINRQFFLNLPLQNSPYDKVAYPYSNDDYRCIANRQ